MVQGTDSDLLDLGIVGHQADLGGSQGQPKNLLDVIESLVLRAGLDVTFRKNKDGNLGSFLLARETGFMSAIGLNKNKLPVLTLEGSKPMYPACPDSLDDLIECYKAAADARAKRMGGRSYHAVHESEESSEDDDAEAWVDHVLESQ